MSFCWLALSVLALMLGDEPQVSATFLAIAIIYDSRDRIERAIREGKR